MAAYFAARSAQHASAVVVEMRHDRRASIQPALAIEIQPTEIYFDQNPERGIPIPYLNPKRGTSEFGVFLLNFSESPAFNVEVEIQLAKGMKSPQAAMAAFLNGGEVMAPAPGILSIRRENGGEIMLPMTYTARETFSHSARDQKLRISLPSGMFWAISLEAMQKFVTFARSEGDATIKADVLLSYSDKLGNRYGQKIVTELVPSYFRAGPDGEFSLDWLTRTTTVKNQS